MSSRREPLDQPRDYVVSRGKWPDGRFEKKAPEVLEFYVGIVKRLIDACEGMETPEVARKAGLSHQTVYNIIQGKSWCELPTVYRLEKALNKPLWHHEHIDGP